MGSKLERLIHLLRTVSHRADRIAGSGVGLSSYAAIGRIFNDYMRQARELAGPEFVTKLDEMEIPQEDADPGAFLGELALLAGQVATELELYLSEEDGEDEGDTWEDAADALLRLREAGVDIDDLVQSLAAAGSPPRLDRRRVDWVCKLAEAGVDVDSLIEDVNFLHPVARHSLYCCPTGRVEVVGRPGAHRGHHRVATVVLDSGSRRRSRGRHRVVETERVVPSEGTRSWQMDILSRVEKGEITADEAAELFKAGRTGVDEEI